MVTRVRETDTPCLSPDAPAEAESLWTDVAIEMLSPGTQGLVTQ